jgi:hypothetical protein
VAGAIAGNISREATQPSGNVLAEAMRGVLADCASSNQVGEMTLSTH